MIAALLVVGAVPARADLRNHKPLHHPIVLIRGATAHGDHLSVGPVDLGEYFEGIPEFLGQAGTKVKQVGLPTDGTIEENAAALKNFLETDPELKGQMVNVVAHSLGGLDARWCVSVLHSMQISSITTIGTPHRGTPLANWAVDQLDNRYPWYWFFRLVGYDLAHRRFLRELTTASMRRFNIQVPDNPDVRYFSVPTKARFEDGNLSLLLWIPDHWGRSENDALSANGSDGFVPYDSQLWGKEITSSGELDHLSQMNHHELQFANQKPETLRVYQAIYENLEREGL